MRTALANALYSYAKPRLSLTVTDPKSQLQDTSTNQLARASTDLEVLLAQPVITSISKLELANARHRLATLSMAMLQYGTASIVNALALQELLPQAMFSTSKLAKRNAKLRTVIMLTSIGTPQNANASARTRLAQVTSPGIQTPANANATQPTSQLAAPLVKSSTKTAAAAANVSRFHAPLVSSGTLICAPANAFLFAAKKVRTGTL